MFTWYTASLTSEGAATRANASLTMENTPRITTVLRIGGHGFNPDELTAVVSILPTKIWHQKREWLKSAAPELSTIGWEYRIDKQSKWSLGEAIEELLKLFWDRRDELSTFLSKNSLAWQ